MPLTEAFLPRKSLVFCDCPKVHHACIIAVAAHYSREKNPQNLQQNKPNNQSIAVYSMAVEERLRASAGGSHRWQKQHLGVGWDGAGSLLTQASLSRGKHSSPHKLRATCCIKRINLAEIKLPCMPAYPQCLHWRLGAAELNP